MTLRSFFATVSLAFLTSLIFIIRTLSPETISFATYAVLYFLGVAASHVVLYFGTEADPETEGQYLAHSYLYTALLLLVVAVVMIARMG